MATLLAGNIVYGGPITCTETHSCKSLGHFVLEKYKSFGNQTVIIDAVTGQEYTAKYMYDSIVRMAYVLQHLGVKNGDVVGLSSENNVRFAITLFASFVVNAAVAPLNVTYTEREVHHAINLSKPKVIFVSNLTADLIAKVAKKNSFVKTVITFGTRSSDDKILNFDDLMNSKEIISDEYFETPVANKEDDVALIVCSSGTTGLPKGVQLTQYNILTTLDAQFESTAIPMGETTLLTVIPWFHAFGCLTLITTSVLRATLVYLPKFEENLFLGAIEKYRIVMAFMVPPLMVFLAKHPLVDKYDLSSLMILVCGAAPLSKETEDQIKKRIGIPVIRQGYGLSESTLSLLVQNDIACKPGSVGGLKTGVYAKVIDPETGRTLGPNQRGELCFKGGCIMKGYIGDPKSTQSVIKDGWLHTGDIGYFDDDFEFFIVDRIKELIKYKGFQVPPAEIEAVLLAHPKIKDAAVIGKPDEEAGELAMAFVVKQPNVELSEDEVITFVADRASPAKRLRGGVIFVDDIPKNPSGKILRRVLRDILKKRLSKL
ncbi:PREDICTED: 4-coumarate--CoA ligase 1 [Rhagoletis zephyria]|uniref:4-coumarate--CoA ligase 1 n=1 Tax=Rhagoletis zephyria TaxID=28612 RepID=UPI0008116997|nr:PREDICTED: 4-coumarate--CoA ligase 1 [Rhagoletis zephyria]XP_017471197.1 PREDICTED: 4-coumarate--CoA ligase 1 [Rhagoletis zephyria]XP_017471198.1 PREDICTED: 4-coumarate--CoA ligase 1 [Rhagoletis zephyria]XP_017471199.1 PREDICTED: 4-coumarate--CoA ligase 1 [Rhagoletis zephyria]XP_017471200.1 PREDICTED: 4-coumarate--CoA ligase 1 [Rhagoletis zephyria]